MASRLAELTDLEYYQSQPDFEDIEELLDLSPVEIDERSLPAFKADYSSAIIIDNVPIVGADKSVKLLGALMKYINKVAVVQESDVYVPSDPSTGMSFGFCFVKFATKEDAMNAIKVLHGVAFDKKHTFNVTSYNDLDTYANITENDAPPAFEFYPRPSLNGWLGDALSRDQFAIRHSSETEIYFSNPSLEDASLVYAGEREKSSGRKWCELNVEWSPQGSYFVTFHKPGVKLWGGNEFLSQAKFMHPQVEEIAFSPCERYLITCRSADAVAADPNDAIAVWDVRTGAKLKSFGWKSSLDMKFQVRFTAKDDKGGKTIQRETRGRITAFQEDHKGGGYFTIEEGNTPYPGIHPKDVVPLQDPNKLKWSADGNYVARLSPDVISIFELPTMALLDKRSIAAKDVTDFAWSPKSNLISYWSPAVGNLPAIINIISIPDRNNVSSRKLFDVTDAKMVWHNDGDYLAVQLTKLTNKKKSYVLMIFRVKDNGIPVEQVEYQEPIINCSWEPSGERLAVMYGDERNPSLDFYTMAVQAPTKAAKGKPIPQNAGLLPIFTKTGFHFTEIHWSPAGNVVALAMFASDSCLFELFDVNNNVVMASRRNDRCNKIAWDPSGRYLATFHVTELRNSHVKGKPEDGVNFFNFQGNLIHQFRQEKLHSFAWRPRPKDLLTPAERKAVIKDIKSYEKEFEKEDKIRKQEINKELQAARFQLAKEFVEWRNKNRALCAQLKPQRVEIRDGYDSDDDHNYEIEVIVEEQVLKTTEQIVSSKTADKAAH